MGICDYRTVTLETRTAVLLGAGASVEAGVPASVSMTRRITEQIDKQLPGGMNARALNMAIGALIAHDTAAGGRAYDGIDVERLFGAIQMLAERDQLEVSPFVSTWNSGLQQLGGTGLSPSFGQHLANSLFSQHPAGANRAFADGVRTVMGEYSHSHVFGQLMRAMIDALRACLHTAPGESDHLAPLLNLGGSPCEIATLNYDLTVEQMAARWGRSVDTGIANWRGGYEWAWAPESDIRLLKLHGSKDWVYGDVSQPGHLQERTIEVGDELFDGYSRHELGIVFGSRGKLRADGPFLAMLVEFERMLSRCEQLVVVGYSFRDDHINAGIRRWLNTRDSPQLTIVDPSLTELVSQSRDESHPFLNALLLSITKRPPFPEPRYVEPPHRVVASRAGEALIKLFGAAPARTMA